MTDAQDTLSKRPNDRASFVATVLVAAALFAFGLYVSETICATKDAALQVKKGMTREEVVYLLGVMYDSSFHGDYKSADKVIAEMKDGQSVSYLCDWRIGFSLTRFYVGFDENDIVVAIKHP